MPDAPTFPVKDTNDVDYVSDERFKTSPDEAMHSTQEKLVEDIIAASAASGAPIDRVALEATALQTTQELGCVTPDGRFAVDMSRFSMEAFQRRYNDNVGSAARVGLGIGGAAVLANEELGDLASMSTTSEGTFANTMSVVGGMEREFEGTVKFNESLSVAAPMGVAIVGGQVFSHYSQTWQDVPFKTAAARSAFVEQRMVETGKWIKAGGNDRAIDCLDESGVQFPNKAWANMPNPTGLRFRDQVATRLIQNRRWIFTGMGLIASAAVLASADGDAMIVDDYLAMYERSGEGQATSPGNTPTSDAAVRDSTPVYGSGEDGTAPVESDAMRVASVSVAGDTRDQSAHQTELANLMRDTWKEIIDYANKNQILDAEQTYIEYLLYAKKFCDDYSLDFEIFKGAKMAQLIQRLKASSWSNFVRTNGYQFVTDHPIATVALGAITYQMYSEFTGAPQGEFVMDLHADEQRAARATTDLKNLNRIEREKTYAYLDMLRGAGQCKDVYDEEYAKLDERERERYREHAGLPDPAKGPVPVSLRPPVGAASPAPGRAEEEDAAPASAPVVARVAVIPDFAEDRKVHDYVYGYLSVNDLGEMAQEIPQSEIVNGLVRVAVDFNQGIIRIMSNQTWQLARESVGAETGLKTFNWESFRGTGFGSGRIKGGAGPETGGLASPANVGFGVFLFSAFGVCLGMVMDKSNLPDVVKSGVEYGYAGTGVVITARSLGITALRQPGVFLEQVGTAAPKALPLLSSAWFGKEAGGLVTDVALDAVGVKDPDTRELVGGLGSAAGAGLGAYGALRLLAAGASKTPVTIVFAAGAMVIVGAADQRQLDKEKAAFLAAQTDPRVAPEFQYVCDVLQAVCQGSLGYGTKPLEQFTNDDLKMLRWLLGEDSFGDGQLSTPLTQDILKAKGQWFVRQYFPDLERGMGDLAAEDYMTADEIAVRRANAAAFSEIKLSFENPGYSPQQYEKLCTQLDTLLADWDPENLKKLHELLYDKRYEPALKIHGADIAANYLEPFMEAQFAFRNTLTDMAEESLQDLGRDDSEVTALKEHRDKYGNWMLALNRHVQNPDYKTIVPLPTDTDRHVATQGVAPRDDISHVSTVASLSLRAPEGRANPSYVVTVVPPRTATGIELQEAKDHYAELKTRTAIQGPTGYWDMDHAVAYWEREWERISEGDQKPWHDEDLMSRMTSKMEELHKKGQTMVVGEVCKLWIQDARDNLDDELGLSDTDMGEALRMLQALEKKVERYQRSGNFCYLNWDRGTESEQEKFKAENEVGDRGAIERDIKDIVTFVDEA